MAVFADGEGVELVDVVDDTEPGEDDHSETGVLHRHKREKKELQAKITSLKHSVSKSDRAKKKQIAGEIAHLEAELASKHERELLELKRRRRSSEDGGRLINEDDHDVRDDVPETESVQESNSNSDANKPKKVTKAQKRRDKKDAKAKESEKIIVESVQQVKEGVRYKEQESVKKMLASKGLTFHPIPADGDCLYNALAHQLSLCGLSTQVGELRQQAASIMRSNRDNFLPFLTSHDGDSLAEEEFEDYCAKLQKPGIWGGHPELVALSTYYKKPIEVLQANAAPVLVGEQYSENAKRLTITYHRHAFLLGEHYNSTVPATESESVDDKDEF